MNHGYFDYGKTPKTPQIQSHALIKMVHVLGSLVYICGCGCVEWVDSCNCGYYHCGLKIFVLSYKYHAQMEVVGAEWSRWRGEGVTWTLECWVVSLWTQNTGLQRIFDCNTQAWKFSAFRRISTFLCLPCCYFFTLKTRVFIAKRNSRLSGRLPENRPNSRPYGQAPNPPDFACFLCK